MAEVPDHNLDAKSGDAPRAGSLLDASQQSSARSSGGWALAGIVSIGLHGWLAGFVAIWGHFAPESGSAGSTTLTATDSAMVIFLDSPARDRGPDVAMPESQSLSRASQQQEPQPSREVAAQSPANAIPNLAPPELPPMARVPAEMPMRLGSMDARSEFASAWLQSLVDGEHSALLDGFDQAQLDQLASPDGSTGLRAQQASQPAEAPGLPGEPGAAGSPGAQGASLSAAAPIDTATDGPGDAALPMSRAPDALRVEAQQALPLLAQRRQEARPQQPEIMPREAIEPALVIPGQGPKPATAQPSIQEQEASPAKLEQPKIDGIDDGSPKGTALPADASKPETDAKTPIGPITQSPQEGRSDAPTPTQPITPDRADASLPVNSSPQPLPSGLGVNPQPASTPPQIPPANQPPGEASASGQLGEEGQRGGGGLPNSSATPSVAPRGPKADRDSDSASIRRTAIYRNGRVDAGKGLDLRTVRPEFSLTTRALSTPASPRVEVAFNRRGFVERVKIITSSGYPAEVDQPIITALYNWRARGEVLDQLPPGPDSLLTLELTIVLR